MEKSVITKLLIICFTIAAIGCGNKEESEIQVDFTKVTNVEIFTVKNSTFEDYITLPVVVMPYKESNVGMTTGGKITNIYVDKGDKVRKGMNLLKIDDVLLKAQYDQVKANLEFQKKEFERNNKLYNDDAINEAQLDALKLQLENAQSSLDMAKKQYEDATLIAPIDGIITMKNVEVGDILAPGIPAFRIIDVSKVKVQVGIPEKYIVAFKEGNNVSIRFDAIPQTVFNGRMDYISFEATPSVRTFLAEILVENSGGLIRSGLMGNAKILRDVHENAIMIPINSIVDSQFGRSVFIASEENIVKEKLLDIGSGSNDTMIMINSGLNVGDRVIVKGQHDLVSGERIKITGEYKNDSEEGLAQ